MAIHPDLPGIVISIDVNGEDLPEYDEYADDIEPNVCVKYVEAVSGAEFGLSERFVDAAAFPHGNSSIAFELDFDGHCAFTTHWKAQEIPWGQRRTVKGAIHESGIGLVKRPMMFSELSIGDGAADKSLIGKIGDLGTIVVRCYKVNLRPRQPENPHAPAASRKSKKAKAKARRNGGAAPDTLPAPIVADGKVSEKTLKGQALTHQAKLGEATTPHAYTQMKTERIGGPVAVYHFKYRSRAALQALHVIPRSPSPVPLEDRSVDELSVEEMRQLLRRQQGNRGENNGVKVKKELKRERAATGGGADEDESDGEIEVVQQRQKRSRSNGPGAGNAVIDLSADD